ncbi:carboxymuconolactone decarboxylase family protein [Kordiimonas gwangyangensis]|uniref:carboxymuconolactone decarboxylase family protein n=1 Tax=Kordiimonas gwangyangensis TaxID=288022 RepID=UPI0003795C4D|nr:carboxymuconolactone decarboxylase family protein [Kordiimonas gwangyangensis]
MNRISVPSHDTAPQASRPLLGAVKDQLGVVPNVFRLIGNSPKVLEGFLGFNGAVAKTLDVKTRERIALAVAEVNGCDYCLSAHTYLATNMAGLDAEEVSLARNGQSSNTRANAAVAFAAKVASTRGRVEDADVINIKNAGYTDGQIVEIVALVADNFFTNILNNVAETEIDFPVVRSTYAA